MQNNTTCLLGTQIFNCSKVGNGLQINVSKNVSNCDSIEIKGYFVPSGVKRGWMNAIYYNNQSKLILV